jgi:hypothetical protein
VFTGVAFLPMIAMVVPSANLSLLNTVFAVDAAICGALFRSGPLSASGPAAPASAGASAQVTHT